ncbi:hypothetical protein WDU94_012004 [Cyamophila willieti]
MKYLFLIGLLVFPFIVSTFSGPSMFVRAEEDEIEDDVDVEGESEGEGAVLDEGEEDGSRKPGGSPDAETTILFTKPTFPQLSNLDLPAGSVVEFLVGFANKGRQDFTLDTLDASLRYPMDNNFYIQNFSTIIYNRIVKPGHEATLGYSFIPAEAVAGRPFGLSINLQYRDEHNNYFYEGIYNETVNITEIDEGLDGETFFLYVFLGACVVLLLVIGQHFLYSVGKKRVGTSQSKKQTVETGTKNSKDIDYDWIPKETLNNLKNLTNSPKSPKGKNPQSPRQRKIKRTAGDD